MFGSPSLAVSYQWLDTCLILISYFTVFLCFSVSAHRGNSILRNDVRLCRCGSAAETTLCCILSLRIQILSSLCCSSIFLSPCCWSNHSYLLPAANCPVHTTMKLKLITSWASVCYWPPQGGNNIALWEDGQYGLEGESENRSPFHKWKHEYNNTNAKKNTSFCWPAGII